MSIAGQHARFSVHIAPMPEGAKPEHAFAWTVEDAQSSIGHVGYASDRLIAWKLALATLRGMIALARVRRNAA